MPRRNKRDAEYPPLDLTPIPVRTPNPFQHPAPIKRGGSAFDHRIENEVGASLRQQAARIRNGVDWSTCLVPGCGEDLRMWGKLVHPEHRRNPEETLPLCAKHTVIVWREVEISKGHQAVIETNQMIRARLQAKRDAEDAARKIRRAACTDGHMYFIRLNELIKVGWTRDIYDRVKSYGASAELLVHYPATRADETTLHRQLRPALAKGREWYHDTDVIQLYLSRALEEHGAPTVKVQWTEPKSPRVRVKGYRG